ncbi:MAG: DNA-binding protein [bacterium]|nr:DNA-binding protein [bacterium]
MEKNIYAYKCKKCGHLHYPYRTICKKCGDNAHNEFDIFPLAKKGTLLTFTHLYTLPADYETVKLTLGIVQLDDGLRITGQLNVSEPKIGMKLLGVVETVRRDDYNNYLGMVFSPHAGGADL